MSSRSLDDLDSRFRPLADKFLVACAWADLPVTIICTLRTGAEQAQAVAQGNSWTQHGKHLPQQPEGKALAMDVCPTWILRKGVRDWAPTHPDWWKIGKIAQGIGLRWGGDWHDQGPSPVGQPRGSWDPGHVEYREPDV